MIIGPLARNDEKVFRVIQNVAGATITTGYLVNLKCGASFDGVKAVLAASGVAADLPGFVGVAAADIANTEYGLVQSYGFAASVRYSNGGTSTTIGCGVIMIPGAALGGAFSATDPSIAGSGFGFIIASNCPAAISAAGWMSGFVRCLH